MLLSDKALSITPYTAGEQPRGGRFVKLNTNENPYAPSPLAVDAIKAFDPASLRLYPDPASLALRTAIARAEGVPPENVFCGNGSDEVLSLSFQAFFAGRQRPVLFPDVTYSFYPVFCAFADVKYRAVPVSGAFRVRPDGYTTGEAGGVVLANPNAPTGLSLPPDEIEKVVRKNPGVPVLIDEAYIDFAVAAVSAVPLTLRYENVLVVKTFSKSYALAGIRCGYAVGSRTLIEGLERVRDSFNSYPVDRVCEAVCAAAVSDRTYFAEKIRDVIRTRDETTAALRDLGVPVSDSDANFLFVPVPGGDGEAAYGFLKERGILVRYWKKLRIGDRLRVTVGTPEQMRAFCAGMDAFCKRS